MVKISQYTYKTCRLIREGHIEDAPAELIRQGYRPQDPKVINKKSKKFFFDMIVCVICMLLALVLRIAVIEKTLQR